MQSRFMHNGIVWVDLESPTREEVLAVVSQFAIDEAVAEELLMPTAKPRCELHQEYFYLIMHFPALRHTHTSKEQEVDFIVGKNFLVTAHYDTIDTLHKFSKVFEVNSILDKRPIGDHAGYLLFYMLKKLYKSIDHEIEYVRRDLARIEEHIFSGHESQMVTEISRAARDLLNLRQTIEPHREVLAAFEEEAPSLFGQQFASFSRGLSHEYYRVHNHIMRSSESLHELRSTNDSLLSTKQNEIMRILTVMALFTFPLSLVVAIFDAHVTGNPIVDMQNGFLFLVILVITLGGFMFWFFKHKRWL